MIGLYLLTGRTWASIGVHAAWNFTQGWIFCAAVSGHFEDRWRPDRAEPCGGAPQLLCGGGFRPEASVSALAVIAPRKRAVPGPCLEPRQFRAGRPMSWRSDQRIFRHGLVMSAVTGEVAFEEGEAFRRERARCEAPVAFEEPLDCWRRAAVPAREGDVRVEGAIPARAAERPPKPPRHCAARTGRRLRAIVPGVENGRRRARRRDPPRAAVRPRR
jgi:hypothetical protein